MSSMLKLYVEHNKDLQELYLLATNEGDKENFKYSVKTIKTPLGIEEIKDLKTSLNNILRQVYNAPQTP